MKKIFLLFLLAGPLAGTLAAQDSTWPLYANNRFEIHYPATWTADTSGLMGTQFVLFSPIENNDDSFRENVNLVTEKTGEETTLAAYGKKAQSMVETMITDAKVVKSTQEGDHWSIEYTGKQGVHNLYFLQHYFVKDGQAWVLTFTCKHEQMMQYLPIGTTVLETFRLH